MNNYIQNIHPLLTNIKNNPNHDGINHLWEYCIRNKIDIERTEINNSENIVQNGFGINGAVVQLFSIFKNDKNFCIEERRKEICQICNNIREFDPTFHSHLIIIDEGGLNLNSIELNISYSLVYDGLMPCDKCNLGNNFPTSRIIYEIISYPKFLFILFDMRSYEQLKRKKELMKNLFIENLRFTEKDLYKLKGCITCPSYNHFTLFINKLDIKNEINELEKNKNYYYDDYEFNGNFQLCNTNDIYEILEQIILPYL